MGDGVTLQDCRDLVENQMEMLSLMRPLAALYLFGKPTQALDGFAQARITLSEGPAAVAAAAAVKLETFGDSVGIRVEPLPD